MSADPIRIGRVLSPRSVALVGASADPQKWGHIILSNLLAGGFAGEVYPVNPVASQILGRQAYPNLSALPRIPDLAVIAVPPAAIPAVVREAAERGVAGGLIITAGLAEAGEEGLRLEREVVGLARARGMVLVGPNCNGVMSPHDKFFCTLARIYPPSGSVAVVSQSGNIAQALAVGVSERGFGLSHYVSSGNEADLTLVDYLEFFAQDDATNVVLAYVEGFRDGRRLLEVAREMTSTKPIVLLKAGATPAGARAAKSHTAVLADPDAIVDAVCKQAGILRVGSIEELIDVGVALASQPPTRGDRVGVLTAAGGYGVLVADACHRAGLKMAELGEETLLKLDEYLPPRWPRGNPVDKSGKVGAGTDISLVEIMLASPDVDGLITLGAPIGAPGGTLEGRLADFGEFLASVRRLRERYQKPVLSIPTWSLLAPEAARRLSELNRRSNSGTFSTIGGVTAAYSALARQSNHVRLVATGS